MREKQQQKNTLDPLTELFVRRNPMRCACVTMTGRQKLCYAAGFLLLLFLLKFRWDCFVFLVSLFLMLCYGAAALLRMGAALFSLAGSGEVRFAGGMTRRTPDEDLPVYTLLLPLYRESAVAEKILARIGRLDYPKEKLDVKLLLEADDSETRAALQKRPLPSWCEIVDVPDGRPRTKPRACNYGLAAARGKYCVIYDAEDAPEPDQLRKAVLAFEQEDSDGRLLCVQAKLNYYNARQNWLTKFFTVEYSTYFDLTLSGLQRFRLPMPLGGTSNHFKTRELREIGGWDPFNVTEDCDLGIRIYEDGYRTVLLDSTTWEEANSRLWNWMRQRSRWVKGFIQTHLVHFRHPLETIRRLSLRGAAGCYILVGGSVLMMLLNLVYWPLILLYGVLLFHGMASGESLMSLVTGPHTGEELYRGIQIGNLSIRAWPLIYAGEGENAFQSLMSQVFFCGSVLLFLSNLFLVLVHLAACLRRKFYFLIPWALLMPFYWVLISLGAWKGAWQFVTNPFYWEKTIHGLDHGKKWNALEYTEMEHHGVGQHAEP